MKPNSNSELRIPSSQRRVTLRNPKAEARYDPPGSARNLRWLLGLGALLCFAPLAPGQLCPDAEPPSDSCSSARVIPGAPGRYEVRMDVGTASGVETHCGVLTGHTVWFEVTPTANGYITFTTCHPATTYDTVIEAYQGGDSSCEFMTSVACNDDSQFPSCVNGCSAYGSTVTIHALANARYRFVVGSYNNNSAGCNLCLGVAVTVCNDDSTPPVAQLTAPAALSCAGNTVSISGSAYDTDSTLAAYSLAYRAPNSGTWTPLATRSIAVTNGSLGEWSTLGLGQGYYYLRLQAQNACGLSAEDVVIVWVDKQFDTVNFVWPQSSAIVGGLVCLQGTVWDSHCFANYTVDYRPSSGGAFRPVDPLNAVYLSPVINNLLANWDTVSLEDGGYIIRVSALDLCGNATTVFLNDLVVDNTVPIAFIASLNACVSVSGVVQIVGTVADANLNSWSLQYTGGDANGWVTIASGTNAAVNAALGTWDTTSLRRCAYTLRLVATDKASRDCNAAYRGRSEHAVSVTTLDCAALDSDGDGMPDVWEIAHFLDRLDATDAVADTDGDGQTNLQEYLAGTDPRVASSVLRILNIERSGNDVILTWASVSNRLYGVYRADGLANPPLWNALTSGLAANAPTRTWTHSNALSPPTGAGAHVYRVGTTP